MSDRPDSCITCNAHPNDIRNITETDGDMPMWCCGVCDAVWQEDPSNRSRLCRILSEGYAPGGTKE